MNKAAKTIDWSQFGTKLKLLLEFASLSSQLPISSDRWEELIFHALKSMGLHYDGGEPKWIRGSHAPGADIWTDNLSISAKSGRVVKSRLVISSYRLTRFASLDEMIAFVDGPGKNFDIYLCCVLQEQKGNRTYSIYSIDASRLALRDLKWSENRKKTDNGILTGWHGVGPGGLEVDIVKNMSNQLWIKFPLDLCDKILELSIAKDRLGLNLDNVLGKLS